MCDNLRQPLLDEWNVESTIQNKIACRSVSYKAISMHRKYLWVSPFTAIFYPQSYMYSGIGVAISIVHNILPIILISIIILLSRTYPEMGYWAANSSEYFTIGEILFVIGQAIEPIQHQFWNWKHSDIHNIEEDINSHTSVLGKTWIVLSLDLRRERVNLQMYILNICRTVVSQ